MNIIEIHERFINREISVYFIFQLQQDSICSKNTKIVDFDHMIPIDPAVKPTARKKTNSSRSLGKEFTIKLM